MNRKKLEAIVREIEHRGNPKDEALCYALDYIRALEWAICDDNNKAPSCKNSL